MANTLIKSNSATFIPARAAIDAVLGQPWLPERWVQSTVTENTPQYTITYTKHYLADGVTIGAFPIGSISPIYGAASRIDPATARVVKTYEIIGYVVAKSTFAGYKPVTRVVLQYIPSQPYIAPSAGSPDTPSRTIIDYRLGWNSAAISKRVLPGDGRFDFSVASRVAGVFVGLNNAQEGTGYTDMEHSIYFTGGKAQVWQNGVPSLQLGAYTAADTFSLERRRGEVVYKKNGAALAIFQGGEQVPVVLDVAMYRAGDSVLNPVLTTYGEVVAILPALRGGGGDATYSFATTELPTLQGGGRQAVRMVTALPRLQALSGQGSYGEGWAVLPKLTTTAQGGMTTPTYSTCENALLPISTAIVGFTGGVGGVSAAFADGATGLGFMVTLASEGAYGASSTRLPLLQTLCTAYEGNTNASLWSQLLTTGDWWVPHETFVIMSTALRTVTVVSVETLADAKLTESATFHDYHAVEALLDAVMRSVVQAGFVVPTFDSPGEVWVVNDEGMSTNYENYGFNSFGKIGGAYYGLRTDGLFALDGDADSGTPIRASIGLGSNDFGTPALKRISNCYLGVASTGQMFLKVIANGEHYVYAARASDDYMATQRVDIGKGLRANFMTFELYNSDGCDFELNSAVFNTITLDRKI